MKTLPAALICAAAAMALCQLFKFIYYSARDRKIGLPYLSTTGGFPSAHSAFVCALTLSVGMRNGFASDIFGISTVFSLLVMYDAVRLRREVQRHAVLLNRLAEKQKLDGDERLSEMVGHSPLQVIVGMCIGLIVSFLLSRFVF